METPKEKADAPRLEQPPPRALEAVYQSNVQWALEVYFANKATGRPNDCQLCAEVSRPGDALPPASHLIRHPDHARDAIAAAQVVKVCAECAESWSQLIVVEL